MGAYKIPEKTQVRIDRMFSGKKRDSIIEALEAGKTVYCGGCKLRAVKIEDKKAPPAQATSKHEPSAPEKTDKGKDKDK
jgi:hypothetical protein